MTLTASIKAKKELSALPDAYVEEHVHRYLSSKPGLKKTLERQQYNEKSKEYRQAVKEVRATLREAYGVFQKASNDKRRALLVRLSMARGSGEQISIIDQLLRSHQSTRERKDHYQELYNLLFGSGKPKAILDVGCGLNPLAYRWLKCTPTYTCCDVSEEDMALVQEFFEQQGIDGQAYACDLLTDKALKKLGKTKADTALLLKLVDTLESQERDRSKKVIDALLKSPHVRRIIISFPQKSIGGRTFRTGKEDNWFTRYLKQQRIGYDRFTVGSEEFYDLSKS